LYRTSQSPQAGGLSVLLRQLESTATSTGQPKVIPEVPLSSKYVYTKDTGKLDEVQRKFFEQNGFIVIRKLVPMDRLAKYEARFKEIANQRYTCPV